MIRRIFFAALLLHLILLPGVLVLPFKSDADVCKGAKDLEKCLCINCNLMMDLRQVDKLYCCNICEDIKGLEYKYLNC